MSYTISPTATTTNNATTSAASGGSTSSLTTDATSITGNYNTFLNLLTAQIKNQDPLSPMDTTQWTNQLVQYSSVEQQLKGNQFLEQIAGAGAANSMNSAVSFIGKTVSAAQDTASLANGSANWDYTLGATADKATVTVVDANGNTVFSGAAPDATKGTHAFTWNGKDSAGNTAPDGVYTLKVTATTAAGSSVDTSIGVSGTVTSAENNGGTVTLKVGNTDVPLSSITGVS